MRKVVTDTMGKALFGIDFGMLQGKASELYNAWRTVFTVTRTRGWLHWIQESFFWLALAVLDGMYSAIFVSKSKLT